MGFFDKIKQSLARTTATRSTRSCKRADEPARRGQPVDVETEEALEEALISADVGVAATEQIVERRARPTRRATSRCATLVKDEIRGDPPRRQPADRERPPTARRS